MSIPPYDQPIDVYVIDGEIIFSGPGALSGSMTRQAAEETARRLLAALALDPAAVEPASDRAAL